MKTSDIICVARSSQSSTCNYVPADTLGLQMTLALEETGRDIGRRAEVRITNTRQEDFAGVICIKLMMEEAQPGIFMPGYMYNTNTADKPSSGRKAFPRIKKNPEGMPESSYFMTRSDRLAAPVSLVYGSGRVRGIAAPPYWVTDDGTARPVSFRNGQKQNTSAAFLQYGGFTCNVNDDGRVSVGYTLGYENAPWLFVQTATVRERTPVDDANAFRVRAGESIVFPMILFDYEGEDERAIYQALEQVYACFHEVPRTIPGMDEAQAVSLLSSAIRDHAWLESERMYAGFVYDRTEGPRYNRIGSLAWTNGLAVAVPMLFAANRQKDEEARRQSLTFIDNVLHNSLNPDSGLLYDAVEEGHWAVRGWWYNGMHSGGHSAYINGQACYYLLRAYLSEKNERRQMHDDWITFLAPVIRRMNDVVNADGEYPFSMSERTGAGLEYDSMGGAWCLAATALYEQVTQDACYLDLMRRSEQHYFDTFVKKCECYGGPLDTDKAVDDEGILAYIRAVRILHEITQEAFFLDHMRDALSYECSFKLCYNTPVSVPPLSQIGWSSCGGSITSTANPHIHPMSSTIIPELRYYVAERGDAYIRSRLEDTVQWSLQTFNTCRGEYGYGEPGWMSERFCFCQGLLTERYPDGSPASTWFALMPWASASIIEGLTF